MPLPSFNDNGDLASGIYRATLSETLNRFGTGSLQRRLIATRLERIYRLALSTRHLFRFVVLVHLLLPRKNQTMWMCSC